MRIRDNIKIVDILDFGVTRENIVLCAAIFSPIPACGIIKFTQNTHTISRHRK